MHDLPFQEIILAKLQFYVIDANCNNMFTDFDNVVIP